MGQGLAALLEFDMEIGLLCSAAFDTEFILSVFVPSFLYQFLFFTFSDLVLLLYHVSI